MAQKISIYVAVVFIKAVAVLSVLAQDIRLGPPIIEVATTPASTQTFYLSLMNDSESDIECSMLIKSMQFTEAGMPVPTDSSLRSAETWIQINQESPLLLKAKETKRILCSVRPPFKTEPGGYYAMILARTSRTRMIQSTQTPAQASLSMRFQMAAVVMVIVKGANLQARVEPEAPIISGGNPAGIPDERNWYLELPVRNDGNIHVVLDGTVQILSDMGQLVRQKGLVAGRGYLLPGQRRIFKAEGDGPLPDGIYTADVRVGQIALNKFATEKIPFYIAGGKVYPGRPESAKAAAIEESMQGFILNQNRIELSTAPGGRRFYTLRLTNIINRELAITAQILPWDEDNSGDIIFPKNSRHGRHLGQNIQVTPQKFLLKPGGKANVKINVQMPKDATGEYFDAIVFNREGRELSNLPSLLLTQSALTFIKAVRTELIDGEYTHFEAQQQKGKNIHFLITLKNKGNVSVIPEGRISIFDAQNQRVGDIIPFGQKSFILPSVEVQYHLQWDRILPVGRYRAEVVSELSKTSKSIKKEFIFQIN